MEVDPLITPQSLKRLSLSVFCAELQQALTIASRVYTKADACNHLRELLGGCCEGVLLSSFLSDEVILYCSTKYTFTGADLSSFCNSKIGTVTKVNLLKCTDITEQAFELLIQYPILELEMCVQASIDSPFCQERLYQLGESPAASTLWSLTIKPWAQEVVRLGADFKWLAKLIQLQRLDVSGVCLMLREREFVHALDQLSNISFLNVSETGLRFFPITLDHLTVLVAHNTTIFSSLASCGNLVGFDALVTLDISQDGTDDSLRVQDIASVTNIYKSLSEKPNLVNLDLSGLVVPASVMNYFNQPHHKMQFLGLVKTEAASVKGINCQVVSGDVTLEQLLVSLRVYVDRSGIIEYVAFRLFQTIELGHVHSLQNELVQAITNVVETVNPKKDDLLNCLSGSLWFLSSVDNADKLNDYSIKRIFSVLIRVLEKDLEASVLSETTIKNFCIVFCRFQLPERVLFAYSRMVKVVVGHMFRVQSTLLKRILISLMNAVVWQVNTDQKLLVKQYGGIKAALGFITSKVSSEICDESLEMAWSFLWNATDEAPSSSSQFVDVKGILLFTDCYKTFQNNAGFPNVLRNMLGTLGNVSEVPWLRCCLVDPELITQLRSILVTVSVMEVQYNVCGIIMNLRFVDNEIWVDKGIDDTNSLLSLTEKCIDSWDLFQERVIQYRSLKPLIAVTSSNDERVVLWGVWALTNLCQVYPHQYLGLFRKEGGQEAMCMLLERAKTVRVRELTSKLLTLASEKNSFTPPKVA